MIVTAVSMKDHFSRYHSAANTVLSDGCEIYPIKKINHTLASKIKCLSISKVSKRLTIPWKIDDGHVFTGYVMRGRHATEEDSLYKLPTFTSLRNDKMWSGITHLGDEIISMLLHDYGPNPSIALLEFMRNSKFYVTWRTILYSEMLYVRFPTPINDYWGFAVPNTQTLMVKP